MVYDIFPLTVHGLVHTVITETQRGKVFKSISKDNRDSFFHKIQTLFFQALCKHLNLNM